MKIYEFGEYDSDGVIWNNFAVLSDESFNIIKQSLIAKFNTSLMSAVDDLDGYISGKVVDPDIEYEYQNDVLIEDIQQFIKDEKEMLARVKEAKSINQLNKIDGIFIDEVVVAQKPSDNVWVNMQDKEQASYV